jgi:hypothetical protein
MNMKEAFRYQNKLQQFMQEATSILGRESNITKVTSTHLRHKVMADAQNETIEEAPNTEFSDRITQVAMLLMYLLDQRTTLSYAIRQAKQSLDMDFDSEVSLNSTRQDIARLFQRMGEIRSSEVTIPNGGSGYRFNAEGNQVMYRCDLKQVTTINYDRNKVRSFASAMHRHADTVSAELDKCLVNAVVDYEPPFDVNSTFAEFVEWFCTESPSAAK